MSRYTDMFDIEVESRPWCGRTWTRWRVRVKGHSRAVSGGGGAYDAATGHRLAVTEAKNLARIVRAVNRLGGAS